MASLLPLKHTISEDQFNAGLSKAEVEALN